MISLLVTVIIVWRALPPLLHQRSNDGVFVGKLLAITAVMVVLAGGSASLMSWWLGGGRLHAALVLLVAITVGMVSAGWLVLHWRLLTDEELTALPGGKHLVAIMNKEKKENNNNETR